MTTSPDIEFVLDIDMDKVVPCEMNVWDNPCGATSTWICRWISECCGKSVTLTICDRCYNATVVEGIIMICEGRGGCFKQFNSRTSCVYTERLR